MSATNLGVRHSTSLAKVSLFIVSIIVETLTGWIKLARYLWSDRRNYILWTIEWIGLATIIAGLCSIGLGIFQATHGQYFLLEVTISVMFSLSFLYALLIESSRFLYREDDEDLDDDANMW